MGEIWPRGVDWVDAAPPGFMEALSLQTDTAAASVESEESPPRNKPKAAEA